MLLVIVTAPASAQVPTSQQMEMLRSLSPADRQQLMEQLGLGEGDAQDSSRSEPTRSTANDRPDGRSLPRTDGDDERLKDPRLTAGDTVLMSIDFLKARPARTQFLGEGIPPIVIPAEPAPEYSEEERLQLDKVIKIIRERNPYVLDREGVLQLPGLRPIPLGGLTDVEATTRLAAEPALLKLKVEVTRLPLKRSGPEALKPFGYDLFNERVSTFAPGADVPVPADYVVGPGDLLNVQLYGSQNRTLRLTVGRDGRLSFPELGPIDVTGKTFESVASDIESRVARQIIGAQASVGLGNVRSIQVFVMGEARKPGAYTVSGLATVTSALYASGGIELTGSLRDVQLKRRGVTIRRLDLYDLLLRGDTSSDVPLLSGDVIFIPPAGPTATVSGEVRRPAIYELKGNATLGGLIDLAGGLTPEADGSRISVVRNSLERRRVAFSISLDDEATRRSTVANGDLVRVARLRPTIDSGVTLEGHVFRPGVVAWREGMRISDLVPSFDELMPNADGGYLLVRRESQADKSLTILSADLAAALKAPGSIDDLMLSPRDRVIVFDLQAGRRLLIDPVLDELRRLSSLDEPTRIVGINGRVKAPGDYPLEPDMRISDLLRAGGSLDPAAFTGSAELLRFKRGDAERQGELLKVDLAAVLRGDASADVLLQPYDVLTVQELPEWSVRESVVLRGEVRFPGSYPIRRGETLRSVLERAGGLTGLAFNRGAVFTREEIREREIQQARDLTDRLRRDLAAAAIQASQATRQGDSTQSTLAAQALLSQLQDTKPVGRLVIDLDSVLARQIGSRDDVILRNGDELFIPRVKQEVTVIGEVQNSTAHLFRSGLSREDYITLSGGTTDRADIKRAYVVRADGSVVASKGGWLGRQGDASIQPGDTIVIPLDVERLPPLPFWQAVTGILYNAAVALAAISSL
jgi:protein involved in polysaccharide export with SLBB domain